jgi:hypothetical protein
MFAAQDSGRKPLTTASATCPIQLKYLLLKNNRLHFEYRNSSDKVLQGIVFGLAYYDSVQDPHRVSVVGGVDRRLAPGKWWKSTLDISYWRNSGYAGWTLWPAKMLFTDGSIWQMGHEKDACNVVNWRDKQITPPPLPSAVMTMPPERTPTPD